MHNTDMWHQYLSVTCQAVPLCGNAHAWSLNHWVATLNRTKLESQVEGPYITSTELTQRSLVQRL